MKLILMYENDFASRTLISESAVTSRHTLNVISYAATNGGNRVMSYGSEFITRIGLLFEIASVV